MTKRTPETKAVALPYRARNHVNAIVEALLPAARLAWENGGWSGASGNWALVEAYDKIESLKEIAPELFARITEKLPSREWTDEPCSMCWGRGKQAGPTVADIQADSFEQGQDHQKLLYELGEKARTKT